MSIYVKKSIYNILSKSLNLDSDFNKKLENLKKEVISILEKKEKMDVRKAVLFFTKDEEKYTYLEKSLDGNWIEKAGYGVGTVRIWKGKKYKKVATNPVKWVRVFDKHTRGAASSMGRYIAQVKRCNSVDELYKFCMKQRSLFQDENGVDLPIMDKLRAAIDEKQNNLESGEKFVKQSNIKEKYSNSEFSEKEIQSRINKAEDLLNKYWNEYKNDESSRIKTDLMKYVGYKADLEDYKGDSNGKSRLTPHYTKKEQSQINKINNRIENEILKLIDRKKQSAKEDFQNAETMSEKFKLLGLKKGQKVEYDGETYTVDAIAGTNHDKGKFQMSILQWDAQGNISKRKYITALNFDKVKPIENKESENKTYWIQDTRGNRLTNEDAKERIKDNLKKIDELNSKDEVPRKEMRIREMENENQYLNNLLNSADRKELESEFEKHQNRSNAMKGNKNAYKGALANNDKESEYNKLSKEEQNKKSTVSNKNQKAREFGFDEKAIEVLNSFINRFETMVEEKKWPKSKILDLVELELRNKSKATMAHPNLGNLPEKLKEMKTGKSTFKEIAKLLYEDAKENKQNKKETSDFYNKYIKGNSDKFKYQLLSRMQSDMKYYQSGGGENQLWAGNFEEQINDMKELYDSLKEKPDWIDMKEINGYKKRGNRESKENPEDA